MSKKKTKTPVGEMDVVFPGIIMAPEEGFTYPSELEFTGIARSVICTDVNKIFRNFRVVTLHIEKGKVVKVEKSDAYANFETKVRLEVMNEMSCLNLDMTYKDGDAWRK